MYFYGSCLSYRYVMIWRLPIILACCGADIVPVSWTFHLWSSGSQWPSMGCSACETRVASTFESPHAARITTGAQAQCRQIHYSLSPVAVRPLSQLGPDHIGCASQPNARADDGRKPGSRPKSAGGSSLKKIACIGCYFQLPRFEPGPVVSLLHSQTPTPRRGTCAPASIRSERLTL
jgi:hypothetical protein